MSGEAGLGDEPAPGDGPARDERPAQSGRAAPDEAPALDGVIHHPTRLTLVAFLSACDEAEFAAVRDGCRVSDSVLSKNASALEAAGYLHVRKGHVGKRPRTWLSLTPAGRQALARHLAALQDLVDAARGAAGSVGA
ncbi:MULTISPECIES: winged helix-turn-helix domain-containing protein [Streptomyces]|uniref:winged helix-turn-helix domain-containing protein n=1 Tax=Streptomyces TaxID=1883 RepID=UPI0002419CD0|nr:MULTISPECIES: transcriptional regulator [Streptomyces]EHM30448.1 MarR/EmrR family transcriptional regulator [Streptomyces sp. W007]MCX4486086.1 transcriptional regulator [Streptomyces anulatus]MCX4519782.1 transcriptional regulator [Streptomyces anulatus]MCX4602664.1 transcriptional regulator [Streptomyces anulatus]WSI78978.1 transcriptional regulator [Streptomyces anulatus]